MPREHFKPSASERHRTVPELRLIEVLLLAGWAVELKAGRRGQAEAATADALQGWIEGGLGYARIAGGGRLFDPTEVVNHLKWAGLTGQDGFWADRYVRTGRSLVESLSSGDAATSLPHPESRFRVIFRRTFDLQHFNSGTPLRLRAPIPLVGRYLDNLSVQSFLSADGHADIIVKDARIEARLLVPADRAVTLGADFSFTATVAAGSPEHLDPAESALYLRHSEGLVRVTPRIRDLAAYLGRDGAPTIETVRAFWSYMLDSLICGAIRYDEVPADAPADWVLERGWYDCQLGSAVLVSLCRAKGIPARIVGGHLLYGLAPTNHFWAEVWIEDRGWTPFDLLCWDLSQGGRDPVWRDHFAGSIDFRMATQCMPLAFTGPMSVRFPPAWHMLQEAGDPGVRVAYTDLADGSLIYSDHVAVENLDPPSG